jgi:hypothetical protein
LVILSDLILEHKAKATSNRVLNADIQKQETTVTAAGKVKGSLDVSIIITYWQKLFWFVSEFRPRMILFSLLSMFLAQDSLI